ncbi:GCN5-related N-acetyltransferase [Candidatus Sulfopaludibacter sp. SbA4]|nr:GCN5-related N-acetyltransferase [Candidatus Sulfopaludibacter sp. SbA4]
MAFDFVIEKLGATHDAGEFDWGVESMTTWITRYALASKQSDTTQTYVLRRRDDQQIIGYYALSAGDVNREAAPERIAKGMPNYPIGVVVLTRLAVDTRFQGRGLAATLLQDAFARVERAADIVGVRALFVHAINDQAREFYLHQGFIASPIEPLHLMLPMKDLRATLKARKT